MLVIEYAFSEILVRILMYGTIMVIMISVFTMMVMMMTMMDAGGGGG